MLVTVTHAANKLAVSKDTIRRMITSGQLPAFKVGHQIRIKHTDLAAVMRRIPVSDDGGEAA